ncbi:MAG: hypothetical protein V2I33_16600 [Kangiellaceae bacterium]|jgi:hypothetical protein|nr:hypothetical protein [Kangiellaceae bacterium]
MAADTAEKTAADRAAELAEAMKKLEAAQAQITQLTQENYELNIQIQNITITQEAMATEVAEHERYLWIKNRPADVPIDTVSSEIIDAQR